MRRTSFCSRLAKPLSDANRYWRGVLFSLLLSLLVSPVFADAAVILLVQSGNAPIYREISSTIFSSLDSICSECDHYQLEQLNLEPERVSTYEVAITDVERAPKLINDMAETVEKVGMSPFKF